MNKVGLDDYLASGKGETDLLGLATSDLRPLADAETNSNCAGPYREAPTGLVFYKSTQHGPVETPLTNFVARIIGQIVEDDGAETSRLIEVMAKLQEREIRFQLSAAEFSSMNWPIERLGTGAVIYAGFGLKDHTRTAIQLLSGEAPERRVYVHTGWQLIEGKWRYLHGGGAIGHEGSVEGIEVRLPAVLNSFELPNPPLGADLQDAIRASLNMLELASDQVIFPIFCAIWRAAIKTADFSLHLAGPTGAGKSVLAALVQQHWGAAMDSRHLPGSWSSTGNALEAVAFSAKDVLLTVDDFAPSGSIADVARLHREGDRLLRAQGNSAGRLRMRADTSLRSPKSPRGLILSTGEDVPRGESLQARLMVLELSPGVLNWQKLTACQSDAAAGKFALCMAGFIHWLARRYERLVIEQDNLEDTFQSEMLRLRQAASQSAFHKRTPEMTANLAIGFKLFLAFAQDAGALCGEEAMKLWRRGWRALGEAALMQLAHQGIAEPAHHFLRLVLAAISSGRAYVVGVDGGQPEEPLVWGWREHAGEWRAQGSLIGWIEAEDLLLEPDAAYATAQSLARDMGESLAVSPKTLHKRLHEQGFLVSMEKARNTYTIRRTLSGSRRAVLHLHAGSLMPREPAQAAHWEQEEGFELSQGQFSGQVTPFPPTETAQTKCPDDAGCVDSLDTLGRLGSSSEEKSEKVVDAHAPDSIPPAIPLKPSRPCFACGGIKFWCSIYGNWTCAVCYPPGCESLVAEWLEIAVSNEGDEAGLNSTS